MSTEDHYGNDFITGKINHINSSVAELIEFCIKRNEGVLSNTGALVIDTGKYTGRSPEDRFIVRSKDIDGKIDWGKINKPIDESVFNNLFKKVSNYLQDKELFIFDGYVGAMKEYQLPIRVICEYASQALFANQLFRRYENNEKAINIPGYTIISSPDFKTNGKEDGVNSEIFIIINFEQKIILIGGDKYCGEIKKAVFTVMNFLMPQKGVLPMHCSANVGEDGNTAIFFGLSGTGKTTLSADPERKLIGDDEHGWCESGIFNFEGGCYAKTINLDKANEKEIFDAIRFGTVLENVVLDNKRCPCYADYSITENTRAAYPLNYIENVELSGIGKVPQVIIFLTADAFGVIPPISRLTKEAAMYHFISGYTSKIAGTERGITEPQVTFSTCFGAPFMPLKPAIYANLLGEKIENHKTEVFLINTGWIAGGYGIGERIKLRYTRAMVSAVIQGELSNVEFSKHPIFNLYVPLKCPNVPDYLLDPKNTWNDKEQYDLKARELAIKFNENICKFSDILPNIKSAGPIV